MSNLIISFVAAVMAVILLTGCLSGTGSTINEYSPDGKLVKQTITTESVITSVVNSTKGKTVIMWEDGWAGYISVSTGTTDDPTPHGKIFAGKINKGAISLLPNQTGIGQIYKWIQATKSDLTVSLDGAGSSSSAISGTSAVSTTDTGSTTVSPAQTK